VTLLTRSKPFYCKFRSLLLHSIIAFVAFYRISEFATGEVNNSKSQAICFDDIRFDSLITYELVNKSKRNHVQRFDPHDDAQVINTLT